MAKEICEDCGKLFEAGPRAFLCPRCRKARLRKYAKLRKLKSLMEGKKKHNEQSVEQCNQ